MIYFIGNKQYDWVKIGVSNDPEGRLGDIRVGCPVELVMFRIESGGQSIERRLHTKFKEQRIRGEWFKLSGPVQEYIDNAIELTRYERTETAELIVDYADVVITLYKDGNSTSQISRELNIPRYIVAKIIKKYNADKVIRSYLDRRMNAKL